MEDHRCGCAVCSLYRMLEENELDLILGASMMEPDIRIKTNKQGFCKLHYDMMFVRKNRLGMALTMESHLSELKKELKDIPLSVPGSRAMHRIDDLEHSCYICGKIDRYFETVLDNLVYIWATEQEFREKFAAQPMFCLPHYRAMLDMARKKMNKKDYGSFAKTCESIVMPYYEELQNDVSWFCKKFDFRFNDEPWYNSKDAVERTMKFLRSDIHRINNK